MDVSAPPKDPTGFYVAAVHALQSAGVPFLVGGAYALECYTGLSRDTKNLDVFVRPQDSEAALRVLGAAGYRTELTFAHWLGKAYSGDDVIDIIFSSGNSCAPVDDEWFAHAVESTVLGVPVGLSPPEEMMWSKGFIMERERYDGADIAHLIRAQAERLDWRRLLRRFGRHWRVLFSHLILFGFIYPSESGRIPSWVMEVLTRRLAEESRRHAPVEPVCCGTLLSRAQYLVDVDTWGYRDARLLPPASMTEDEVAEWTAAIEISPPTATGVAEQDHAAGGNR